MTEPLASGNLATAAQRLLKAAVDVETRDFGPNRVVFAVGGRDSGGSFSLTDFTMAAPPAPGPPPHVHEDADECVYVLEGTLEMGIDDDRLVGSAGSVMLAPRGTLHSLANLGPGEARFVVVLAPPGFEGYWRAMADLQSTPGGPPDRATVLELQQRFHMSTGGEARRLR